MSDLVNLVKKRTTDYLDEVVKNIGNKSEINSLLDAIGTSDQSLIVVLILNNYDVLGSVSLVEWKKLFDRKDMSITIAEYVLNNAGAKTIDLMLAKQKTRLEALAEDNEFPFLQKFFSSRMGSKKSSGTIKTSGTKKGDPDVGKVIDTMRKMDISIKDDGVGEITKGMGKVDLKKAEEDVKTLIKKKGKIELYDFQVAHMKLIMKILEKYTTYYDTSLMGTGKTVVTFKVAEALGYKIFGLCPAIVVGVWDSHGVKMKMEKSIIDIVSYDTFKGSNSDWYDKSKGEVSRKMKDLIKKGKVLFVFDEAHKIKNTGSQRSMSVYQIINEIIAQKATTCKVAVLGGTLHDYVNNAFSFFKLSSALTADTIADYSGSKRENDDGYQEILTFCRTINAGETDRIVTTYKATKKKEMEEVVYQLITHVAFPVMRAFMLFEPKGEVIHRFFPAKGTEYQEYAMQVRILEEKATETNREKEFTTMFTLVLKNLEMTKVKTIVRAVTKDLEEDEDMKIVIFVDFIDTINYLEKKLHLYDPLVIYGQTSKNDRNDQIEDFQKDNDNARVMIITTGTGGAGISLNDKTGKYKRKSYFTGCTYSYINFKQAIFRTIRADSVSWSEVIVVHLYDASIKDLTLEDIELKENKILANWYKKKVVLDNVSGRDEGDEFKTREDIV